MFKRFNENCKREPFILIPVILSWILGLIVTLDVYLCNISFVKGSIFLALLIWCLFWVPFFFIKEKN